MHHYFGTKDDLFMAALQLPVDPRDLLAPAIEAGPDGAAERLLRIFLAVWDDPQNRLACLGLFRSVMEPPGERLLRDGFLPVVLRRSASASASTGRSCGCHWWPPRSSA